MENGNQKMEQPIKSFRDLRVYQLLYGSMLLALKEIVTQLPKEDKFDLADQMRGCAKASPALLAEGFAKRYQKRNWHKYLDDCIGECNEMIHHLSVCRDVYSREVNKSVIEGLLSDYDLAA